MHSADAVRTLRDLVVRASAPDGSVQVTVGAKGDLRNVRLDPRALGDGLSEAVVATARAAAARATAQAGEIARPFTNRRPGEPVDALFDMAVAEFERRLALPPRPARPGPAIEELDAAAWRDRVIRLRNRLRDTEETATSPDGLVTATVGGRGELTGLRLDRRAVRGTDANRLAGAIVAAAHAAFGKVEIW